MEYLGIEIEWGCTIYSDNTISKKVITRYEDLKSLRQSWEKMCNLSDEIDRKVRLLSLSIETTKFVPSEEYFKHMEEEE